MADPLNMTGLVGLYSDRQDVCTIEASCVTGFEPMAQEEIKVTVMRVYLLSSEQAKTSTTLAADAKTRLCDVLP